MRHATLPVGGRARLPLPAPTSRTVEATGRNPAGDLDPAFWHADSRKFEGEAARVACARAVWGPLVGGESAAPSTQSLTFDAMGELRMEYSAALIRDMLASGLNAITITLCDPKPKKAALPCVTPARRGEGELNTGLLVPPSDPVLQGGIAGLGRCSADHRTEKPKGPRVDHVRFLRHRPVARVCRVDRGGGDPVRHRLGQDGVVDVAVERAVLPHRP